MKEKILILLAIFVLLLFIGCTETTPQLTFQEGVDETKAILVNNNINGSLVDIDPANAADFFSKEDIDKAREELTNYKSELNTSSEDGKALGDYIAVLIKSLDLLDTLINIDPETFTLMSSGDFSSFCTTGDLQNMDSSFKAMGNEIMSLKSMLINFESAYPSQAKLTNMTLEQFDSSFSSVGFELFIEIDKPFERLCGIVNGMTVTGETLTDLQKEPDFCDRLDEYNAAEVAFIAELDKFIDYMEEASPALAKSNPTMSQQYEDTALQMESMKLIITSGGDAFIESNCQ